jgi:hypothetical protein
MFCMYKNMSVHYVLSASAFMLRWKQVFLTNVLNKCRPFKLRLDHIK